MSIKLVDAKVLRAGVTARYWRTETSHVELKNARPGEGIRNCFTMASKGGGDTSVEYVYGARDYKAHLRMMVHNDRNAALGAISEILHEQMVELSAREAEVARAARREIAEAAHNRWLSTHGTDEAIAKIVQDGIDVIIAAVEKPKAAGKEQGA